MSGVLFWNVHMRDPDSDRVRNMEDTLVEIVAENDCDILVLAEYGAKVKGLCDVLSILGKNFTERPPVDPLCRLKILADSVIMSEVIMDSPYYAIYNCNMLGNQFLLGGVHLPSKRDGGPESICQDLAMDIREAAAARERIVLVGDFNANPFEKAMADFDYLHAIFDAETVKRRRSRKYRHRERPLFYNPSWTLLDERNYPKGSYWYGGSVNYQLYWNVLDQVIMNVEFMELFQRDSLKLITGTRDRTFLTPAGKPDKAGYSDHLPLYFTFQEGIT